MDIEELVDDFVTFYIGGQDTSMSLLIFALVLTLLHPNVTERLIICWLNNAWVMHECMSDAP